MKTFTHCQICGRAIQAKTGLIAHHGYQRPGEGWQTASCMGARFRPYEVACDRIAYAIEACDAHINRQKAALDKHMNTPPATLTYQQHDAWGKAFGSLHTFDRPADFDPANHRPSYQRLSYTFQFDAIVSKLRRDIEASELTRAFLQQRLDAWKPPAA